MCWIEGLLKIFPKARCIQKLKKRSDAFSFLFILGQHGLTYLVFFFNFFYYRFTLHLFVTPALPYIFHFYNEQLKIQGCVQFHYSSPHLQVLSAGFRNALLIG